MEKQNAKQHELNLCLEIGYRDQVITVEGVLKILQTKRNQNYKFTRYGT